MLLARIARRLSAHGNIKTSKSGMNLSGQNSPAIPNATASWTTKYSHKSFTVNIPMRQISFHWNVTEALRGSYEGYVLGDGMPP
jgi:hypothetical protein